MRKFLLFTGVMAFTLMVVVGGHVAYADQPSLTEAHSARIRANCVAAQSTMTRLHTSDTLLRVNQGRLYEQISTKLMARLNSRIAFNRMKGDMLLATTAAYEREMDKFRTAFQQYESAIMKAIKIDCIERPVDFYYFVGDARTKRQQLHATTVEIAKLAEEYRGDFEEFASSADAEDKQ